MTVNPVCPPLGPKEEKFANPENRIHPKGVLLKPEWAKFSPGVTLRSIKSPPSSPNRQYAGDLK